MTDKEILKKAIEIAIENGLFSNTESSVLKADVSTQDHATQIFLTFKDWRKEEMIIRNLEIIFRHDFAKAFWKNDFWAGHISTPVGENGRGMRMSHRWQYHLQQMVLEENPINYLRKFINTEKSKS